MLASDGRYLIKKAVSVKAEKQDHLPDLQTTTFCDGFEGLSDLDNEVTRRKHDYDS